MPGQDSRLSLIAHWYATEGDGVPWVVIQAEGQDGHGMHHAIAECDTQASAEMIARALNTSGAVDAAEIVAWLRGRTGYGGGFTSADDVADAIERRFITERGQ